MIKLMMFVILIFSATFLGPSLVKIETKGSEVTFRVTKKGKKLWKNMHGIAKEIEDRM